MDSYQSQHYWNYLDNFNNVEIGSYPFNKEGQFGTSLVMRSADLEALDRCEDEITKMIKKLA